MNRFPVLLAILLVLLVNGGLVISGAAQEETPQTPEADTLTLVDTINVGGEPDTIVVDCAGPNCGRRYDIAFIDQNNDKLRFLDGDTLQIAGAEISVPIGAPAYSWMCTTATTSRSTSWGMTRNATTNLALTAGGRYS